MTSEPCWVSLSRCFSADESSKAWVQWHSFSLSWPWWVIR